MPDFNNNGKLSLKVVRLKLFGEDVLDFNNNGKASLGVYVIHFYPVSRCHVVEKMSLIFFYQHADTAVAYFELVLSARWFFINQIQILMLLSLDFQNKYQIQSKPI